MKKINLFKNAVVIATIILLASCSKNDHKNLSEPQKPEALTEAMMAENGSNPDEASVREMQAATHNGEAAAARDEGGQHFLFTESNATGTNEILAFKIHNNGSLQKKWTAASGGAGTGVPLGSQGAIVLDKDGEWLFAVNAAANSVSSFEVKQNGKLTLAHTISSMGQIPVSLALHGRLLYVLNRGSDNIHGFKIGNNGSLTHINNSTRALSGAMVDAPQVAFTPDGNWVVVTEKASNKISTYKVKNDGSIKPGIFTHSTGTTPFGFEFARGKYMIVSNATGGAPAAGTATSYYIDNSGMPNALNGAVPNNQGAPCWVAVTAYGRYAFITNTASNSISTYYVAPGGNIHLVDKAAGNTDKGPLDIVVASNNYYVYAITAGSHTINGFKRGFFGSLYSNGTETGLPTGATGLATF